MTCPQRTYGICACRDECPEDESARRAELAARPYRVGRPRVQASEGERDE